MNQPLIISCPIVGAELTRETYPNLPLTPEELAIEAEASVKAGASIIHLHVRDEEGKPSQRVDLFEKTSRLIHERVDCILQYSTGGAVGTPLSERLAPLKLKPEMGTLSMGTLNFGSDVFENTEEIIRGISAGLQEYGCMAELEIFDAGMMDTLHRYAKKGWLPKHFHVDFVLGVPGGLAGDLENLLFLIHKLPPGQSWSVAGVGRFQLPLAIHAIALGGHVRVGLEDNVYYRKGELATGNAQLVSRIANISRACDREVATVKQAREILKIGV
ncbi:MAG: 3-keto-5-aminohexanoate cleavage protein [Candidatus Cloacimonetes bacterium]|nr:3-keto-5-aminohexanoate cleavage protein [Candidatus Cloacimonadota bacterium]